MKKLGLIFIFGILNSGAFAVPAVVNYIFDGDTFAADVVLEDGIKIPVRVRLDGVDTPEIHGNCDYEIKMANMAKERLAQLLPVGSTVELQDIKDDKYLGRIDAKVITANKQNVADILVKEKLGRKYNGGKRLSWCK